jgi:hypothetical protein
MNAREESVNPDARDGVVMLYGATMMAVQTFERSLATLVLVLGVKKRSPKTPERAARKFVQAIKRSLHIYQRASAAELRDKLPDDFDAELMADIELLIDLRDRLAHRYLLEKIVDRTTFQPGTALELIGFGREFGRVEKVLRQRYEAVVASFSTDETPNRLAELVESLARPVMFGGPWTPPSSSADAPE